MLTVALNHQPRQINWSIHGSDAKIKEIQAEVKALVEESVQFAEESEYPKASELYEDVYIQKDYPFVND